MKILLLILAYQLILLYPIENKSIDLLGKIKDSYPVLSGQKVRLKSTLEQSEPDVDLILTLIEGRSLISVWSKSDSIDYKIYNSRSRLNIPRSLRKKFLSRRDFRGNVFRPVEINGKKYVKIKLENKTSEVIYFIFEFDSNDQYLKYYDQYLIY